MRVLLFWSLVFFFANLFSAGTAFAKPPASKKELQCLAQNVYFEARGESSDGQLAVALVTMHRVKSRRYPSTICNVVWQRRSCTTRTSGGI